MTVFDIANRRAVSVNDYPAGVLRCFDPTTTLYLMEPGNSVVELRSVGLSVPTLPTVSQLVSRHKNCGRSCIVSFYN